MTKSEIFAVQAGALLGERGWTRDNEIIAPWLTDWRGRFTGRVLGMASPADTAQVAALVRLCSQHGVPIVPRAAIRGCRAEQRPMKAAMRFCCPCAG